MVFLWTFAAEDQEGGFVCEFGGLVKTESGFLIMRLTKVELIALIEVLCTCECFVEAGLCDLFFFLGVQGFLFVELESAGVV